MATTSVLYGTSTAVTCTLASLADSATVGRQSTVVDNTSNLYDDALLFISVTTAGTVATPFAVYVYIFGSEDGTNFIADDGVIGTTDAAYTVNAASNLKGPFIISTPTTAKIYSTIISIASCFGGVMPRKWGFVVVNDSGAALNSSEGAHIKTYTGVKTTIA